MSGGSALALLTFSVTHHFISQKWGTFLLLSGSIRASPVGAGVEGADNIAPEGYHRLG